MVNSMAKDDYDVIVYRVLVYLYGCLKHKIVYEDVTFEAAVKKNIDSDEYFFEVLRMMQDEGLIEGFSYVKAWGGDIIATSDMSDMKITAAGVRYLKDNGTMQKVGIALKDIADLIAKLATMLSLI